LPTTRTESASTKTASSSRATTAAKRPRKAATLTSKQRSYLRGLAHALSPVLQIGKAGSTQAFLDELERALEHHELIKLRMLRECPTEPNEMFATLQTSLGASVVGSVGRVVTLYRERSKDPTIKLPVEKTNKQKAANAAALRRKTTAE
jgi:RNA-binding protein